LAVQFHGFFLIPLALRIFAAWRDKRWAWHVRRGLSNARNARHERIADCGSVLSSVYFIFLSLLQVKHNVLWDICCVLMAGLPTKTKKELLVFGARLNGVFLSHRKVRVFWVQWLFLGHQNCFFYCDVEIFLVNKFIEIYMCDL